MRSRTPNPIDAARITLVERASPSIKVLALRQIRRNKNLRTHPRRQIQQIANSIARFGWTSPILVDERNVILAGHGRYQAALQLGLSKVPVIVVSDLSDVEKRALALADNKIAANAGWDRAALAAELGELAVLLPECDLSIEITGFEPAEIDSLMVDLVDPENPDDEPPEIKSNPISPPGRNLVARPASPGLWGCQER
jgi:ParB-like chromosome segregation protein Spo0J